MEAEREKLFFGEIFLISSINYFLQQIKKSECNLVEDETLDLWMGPTIMRLIKTSHARNAIFFGAGRKFVTAARQRTARTKICFLLKVKLKILHKLLSLAAELSDH